MRLRGRKVSGARKAGIFSASFDKSVTNGTDNSIKRLENRLDNKYVVTWAIFRIGKATHPSNEYETHCDRFNETTLRRAGTPCFCSSQTLTFLPRAATCCRQKDWRGRRLHTIYVMVWEGSAFRRCQMIKFKITDRGRDLCLALGDGAGTRHSGWVGRLTFI